MDQNVQKQNVQSTGDIVRHLPDGSTRVLSKNILTTNQVIFPGMIVLKAEGNHFNSITIREIVSKNGILFIKIENNETGNVGTISMRIGTDYNLWTLISYEYLADIFLFNLRNKGT